MSEPYQIFAFVKDGMPVDRMIASVDEVLRAAGGVIDEDCLLMLADHDSQEPDPEPVDDASEALSKLRAWPTLGSISYSMLESVINVTFLKDAGGLRVHCCKISILPSALETGGEAVKARYTAIATALSQRLSATRVMFDWGIESKGLAWRQELERLERGEFLGRFELDLRG